MTTAAEMVSLYIAAETAVLEGRSATIGGTTLTMEDLDKIRAGRKEWETRAAQESAGAGAVPAIGGRGFSVARMDR